MKVESQPQPADMALQCCRSQIAQRLHDLGRDCKGQISFLVVCGALALVAILGMVITTGDQAAQKIRLQNAADEAALAGGTFLARGMNVISAFNVLQTQLTSAAVLLQALDEALDKARRRVRWQNGFYSSPACGVVFGALCQPAAQGTALQLQALDALIPIFHQLTQLLASCEYGLLWTINQGLENLGDQVHRRMGRFAAAEAQNIAELNGADRVEFLSLALDDTPGTLRSVANLPLPLEKGSFADHCDPMIEGSPESRLRGYHPLLGYPVGVGPFTLGKRRIGRFLRPLAGLPPQQVRVWEDLADNQLRHLYNSPGQKCRPPQPYLLRQEEDALSFLVIVWRANRRSFFGGNFVNSPSDLVTYAQVEIYNGIHADTYTQDWRVRLAPASLISLASPKLGGSPSAAQYLNNH